MPTEFVNPPDIKEEDWKWAETALQYQPKQSTKLFETKEKARVWLQKFREAENSLGTLNTPQEGVNTMTNTNLTSDFSPSDNSLLTNSNPEGVKARYFPQKEVLIYQAEEDVMPVEQVDVNRSI